MPNVTSLDNIRQRRNIQRNIDELKRDVSCATVNPLYLSEPKVSEHTVLLEELDALADSLLIRKLALIHRKEATMRAWAAEEEAMASEMESAVYSAFCSGVPEEAIYDLDSEPLAEALNRAIRKVEATA